jgi:hypothetical protein
MLEQRIPLLRITQRIMRDLCAEEPCRISAPVDEVFRVLAADRMSWHDKPPQWYDRQTPSGPGGWLQLYHPGNGV